MKSYAYLDQAAVQLVDLKASLEDTLMILKHKLKTVTVVEDFAADLPRLQAYAGELNQVWTNLIDNAADAMGGKRQAGRKRAAAGGCGRGDDRGLRARDTA